jgi:hypothetical protein
MKRSIRKCFVIGVASIFGSALWADTRPTEAAYQPSQTDVREDNLAAISSSVPRVDLKLASEPTASKLKITVLIYNYAETPHRMLSRATEAATTVFQRVGVETAWLDCTASTAKGTNDTSCTKQSGPTHLVVRILPRSMAKRVGQHHSAFGFALPASEGRFGYIANVFSHRVSDLARSRGDEERPIILGHMLAHEMGHLLLGLGSHSDTGIMHVPWNGKQLDRVRFNNLLFTPKEAEQIRRQIAERSAAE